MQHPDWQARTELLIGAEKLSILANSHVLVVGLGGVGAIAAEQLVRVGIGEISIVDGDIINESNINRQLQATHSVIGKSKLDILAERLLDINPQLKLHGTKRFIPDTEMAQLVKDKFDYIIDAIDSLSPKVHLIYESVKQEKRIISSMGSGGKLNPALVKVEQVEKSFNCKLAFKVRKQLHRMGIYKGFKVVFSSEKVNPDTVIKTYGEQNKKSTVGTISYIPSIFGLLCASEVIRDLTVTKS